MFRVLLTATVMLRKLWGGVIIESFATSSDISSSDLNMLRLKFYSWDPYDHTFGYYLDRINGYYRTTGAMRTLVKDVMVDLMTPMK